jgi:hypothetical protein
VSRKLLDALLASEAETPEAFVKELKARRAAAPPPRPSGPGGVPDNRNPVTGNTGDRGIFTTALGRGVIQTGFGGGPERDFGTSLEEEARHDPVAMALYPDQAMAGVAGRMMDKFTTGRLQGKEAEGTLTASEAGELTDLLNAASAPPEEGQASLATIGGIGAAIGLLLLTRGIARSGAVSKVLGKGAAKLGMKAAAFAEKNGVVAAARQIAANPKAVATATEAVQAASKGGVLGKIFHGAERLAWPVMAATGVASLPGVAPRLEQLLGPKESEQAAVPPAAQPSSTAKSPAQRQYDELQQHDVERLTAKKEWWTAMAPYFQPEGNDQEAVLSRYLLSSLATEAALSQRIAEQRRGGQGWSDSINKYFDTVEKDPSNEMPIIPGSSVPTDDMVLYSRAIRHGVDWTPPSMRGRQPAAPSSTAPPQNAPAQPQRGS